MYWINSTNDRIREALLCERDHLLDYGKPSRYLYLEHGVHYAVIQDHCMIVLCNVSKNNPIEGYGYGYGFGDGYDYSDGNDYGDGNGDGNGDGDGDGDG